jgi:hypothetical protein
MCGWLFPSPTGAPRWLSVPMHSAGAAKGHAAAKLCSRESKYVAQVPQQGQVGIAIESAIYPIHFEFHFEIPFPNLIQYYVRHVASTQKGQTGVLRS